MISGVGKNSGQVAGGFMKAFIGWKRPAIVDKLKTETDELHHKLQRNIAFDGLTGNNPSVEKYKALLIKFLPFYRAIEERLEQVQDWKSIGFDFEGRRKANLIEKDLKFLGVSDEALNVISVCENIPDIKTLPEALGCLYVLEGATLGAQQMARNMNAHFEYNRDSGAAFLLCYGEGPGVGNNFKEVADFIGIQSSSANETKIITSAKATFEYLDRWLSKS